jgi:ABC-type glycerol-3-phosphate transport system substrate-binding protein
MDENTSAQTFGAGNVGMMFGYPAWITQSKDFPFKTATARPVQKVKRSSALGGWYLTVPSKGKNPAGAYDFLSWLIQPDTAVTWNLGMGNSPTTQAAVDTKAYQDFLKAHPLEKAFDTALAEDATAPAATPKFNQVLTPIAKAISLAIYQKETPKQALDEAAKAVDDILAKK